MRTGSNAEFYVKLFHKKSSSTCPMVFKKISFYRKIIKKFENLKPVPFTSKMEC